MHSNVTAIRFIWHALIYHTNHMVALCDASGADGIHVSNLTYHAYHLHLPHAKYTNSSCQLRQRMNSGAESLKEKMKGRREKDKEREHSLSSAEEMDVDRSLWFNTLHSVLQTFPVDLFLHV